MNRTTIHSFWNLGKKLVDVGSKLFWPLAAIPYSLYIQRGLLAMEDYPKNIEHQLHAIVSDGESRT